MVLDIPSISVIVAATGVIIGVFFTCLELRNLARTRRTELHWRIFESINSKEFLEASMKVMDVEFKDLSYAMTYETD